MSEEIDDHIKKLKAGSVVDKICAAEALGTFQTDTDKRVAALIEALQNDDPRVVSSVVLALSEIGPAAFTALDSLVALSDTTDELLDQSICVAIHNIAELGVEQGQADPSSQGTTRISVVPEELVKKIREKLDAASSDDEN